MKRRTFFKNTLLGSAGILFFQPVLSTNTINQTRALKFTLNELKDNFFKPPFSAHPQVWWAWNKGHITKEAITSDLEGMKRVGIRGFELLEFSEGAVINGPVIYGSQEHFQMIAHTCKEAERLGLEFSIHNCPGWSATGGPWITPELSMQVLTWSEFVVDGGKKIQVALKQPVSQHDYYEDEFVIAFPTQREGILEVIDWRRKANFPDDPRSCHGCKSPQPPEPFITGKGIIDPSTVIDITEYMDSEGYLDWYAPAGNWTILRIGHTTTSSEVFPAPEGGAGLECDKFNKHALDIHFDNFFNNKFLDALKPLIDKGLASVEIDSFEAGLQNWTHGFQHEFQNHCGYNILNYMPAMTGRVVGSIEISDRFLWDVRKTHARLMYKNYFEHFAKKSKELGIKSYAEAYYMTIGAFDNTFASVPFDVPMGEFWSRGTGSRFNKIIASVGHLNAKPIIAAEAWTMDFKWRDYPGSLKMAGDLNYTLGMNHFYLNHMAVCPEPYPLPELYIKHGSILNTNNTWFEQGKSWIEYMSRCEYLLQQGKFVADILYFGGEDSPVKLEVPSLNPKPPYGYDFDIASTDVLDRLMISDGLIVVPGCMKYKVFVLPAQRTMTLDLLRKLSKLTQDGMRLIVIGAKPERTSGLKDYTEEGESEFRQLTEAIWQSDSIGKSESRLGKGIVYSGMTIEEVLEKNNLKPDFEYTSKSGNAVVNKIHRRVDETDIYFIASRSTKSEELVCTFRVKRKRPEIWNAISGKVTPCPVVEYMDDRTIIPIRLQPLGSLFIVFQEEKPTTYFTSINKDNKKLYGIEPYNNSPYNRETIYFSQGNRVIPELEAPPPFDMSGSEGNIVVWENGKYTFINNHGESLLKEISSIKKPVKLKGSWDVSFESKSVTPGDITLTKLISFTKYNDYDVKHFSGTATYKKRFEIEESLLKESKQIFLDLGRVMMIAEVIVNGKNLGILWTSPFMVNITGALHSGDNYLEIKITNTWLNRLIANQEIINEDKNNPKAGPPPADRNFRLQEAGLLGPVMLRTALYYDFE